MRHPISQPHLSNRSGSITAANNADGASSVASTSAWATPSVPWANGSISKTPRGPFQTTVPPLSPAHGRARAWQAQYRLPSPFLWHRIAIDHLRLGIYRKAIGDNYVNGQEQFDILVRDSAQ